MNAAHNMNNNEIKIANKFSSLTEAVKGLNVDISYNEREALKAIKEIERMEVQSVFSDESSQIWYIIRAQGLSILNKYEPFHSVLSSGPLSGYVQLGDKLKKVGSWANTSENRNLMAMAGVIAG